MEEYKKKIGIPDCDDLVQTETTWKQRKGQDTDTYWYDHVDENGNVIAKYKVEDSTSTYPPFGRNISYNKIG